MRFSFSCILRVQSIFFSAVHSNAPPNLSRPRKGLLKTCIPGVHTITFSKSSNSEYFILFSALLLIWKLCLAHPERVLIWCWPPLTLALDCFFCVVSLNFSPLFLLLDLLGRKPSHMTAKHTSVSGKGREGWERKESATYKLHFLF